jgi:hypothetical protein
MSDQFWLTKAQLKRIETFFPRTRGIPRVDDRKHKQVVGNRLAPRYLISQKPMSVALPTSSRSYR